MVGEPENLVLIYLRRLDSKADRIDDLSGVGVRLANLEEGSAVLSRRLDRLETRVERIERRLDLVDMPH